jgi:flagellar hook-associated protein 1 FlgK
MTISAIFNAASSSLAAQRVALDVTGENIANVNTDGYSRQRVILETASGTNSNSLMAGNGVKAAAVQRMYDNVLNKQINDGNSLQGNNDTKLKTLQQVEPYLNELSGNSIGDAMQGLSDAWQSLSLNATGITERQAVIGKAQVLVDTFHQVNQGITNAQSFADQSLTAVATDVTSKGQAIADLNLQIRTTELSSGNSNELRDRRDLLIQQLSKQVGITYAEQPDGMMDIKLMGGETLVSGNQYATVYTNPGALGVTSNEIRITALGTTVTAPNLADAIVTATIGGTNNSKGEIGGLLYSRDNTIPGYLAKLDELAYNISYQINTQHAAGWNLNNATGIAFFTPPATLPPPAPGATYAGYSSMITVGITTTNEVAAADTNPSTGGIGNNRNALLLANVAYTEVAFSGGATATTSAFYNSLVSAVGVEVQSTKNLSTQNEAFIRQLNNLRDSNSGVSLDEELTNLIKYQKAFEGASKVISTVSQMMDTLLGMVR